MDLERKNASVEEEVTDTASATASEGNEGEESSSEATSSPDDGDESTASSQSEEQTDWQDRYLRLYAEFDNYRKRTMRERVELIRALRRGDYDVLVGINLLREGLDIPEVSLVAILDADKEGFLRSARSLIQTIGRASRNVNGRVILYADSVTGSMRQAMDETDRRREIQEAYNIEHGITPETIRKSIGSPLVEVYEADHSTAPGILSGGSGGEAGLNVAELRRAMRDAAENLDFERAAELRDRLKSLDSPEPPAEPSSAGRASRSRGRGSKR